MENLITQEDVDEINKRLFYIKIRNTSIFVCSILTPLIILLYFVIEKFS